MFIDPNLSSRLEADDFVVHREILTPNRPSSKINTRSGGSVHGAQWKPSGKGRGPVKKMLALIGGWTLIVVGVALLVLPGPGLLLIVAGLALLATEYSWAHTLLGKAREKAKQGMERMRGNHGGTRRGAAPATDVLEPLDEQDRAA